MLAYIYRQSLGLHLYALAGTDFLGLDRDESDPISSVARLDSHVCTRKTNEEKITTYTYLVARLVVGLPSDRCVMFQWSGSLVRGLASTIESPSIIRAWLQCPHDEYLIQSPV